MKNCGTCRWWGLFSNRHGYSVRSTIDGARICCQNSGDRVIVRTFPEDGCIHHEPKDDGE